MLSAQTDTLKSGKIGSFIIVISWISQEFSCFGLLYKKVFEKESYILTAKEIIT